MSKPHELKKQERRVLNPDEEWAAGLVDKMRSACHPWQLDAVDDTHRRISLLTGRGGGKTTAFVVRAVRKCVTRRLGQVLYFATTEDQARELVWDPLKELCSRLLLQPGRDVIFNETQLRCLFLRTGSVYQLSGMENTKHIEKWRGKTRDEVQVDEGASHKNELLDALLNRILGPRMRGTILIAGTAGHIMAGTFYEVTRPGSSKHTPYRERATTRKPGPWSSHRWDLDMVMALPDARSKYPEIAALWDEHQTEFEDQGWGIDSPIRKREYRAIWAADDTTAIFQYRPRLDDGTPWNEWDPERIEAGPDRVSIAKLPPGPDGKPREDWLYAFAMDHGAKDPFALNVFAASPSDTSRCIYHVYGFEQPGMYARRIAILLLGPRIERDLDAAHANPGGVIGAIGGWPTGMVSDIAQLGEDILKELSEVYGIRILAAEQKGKLAGIELVNSDLVDGRLKILKGSTLAQQLSELQWVRDEYGFPKENKAQANHSSDTLIYGRREMGRLFDSAREEPPKDKRRVETAKRDVFAEVLERSATRPSGEYDYLLDTSFDIFKP